MHSKQRNQLVKVLQKLIISTKERFHRSSKTSYLQHFRSANQYKNLKYSHSRFNKLFYVIILDNSFTSEFNRADDNKCPDLIPRKLNISQC